MIIIKAMILSSLASPNLPLISTSLFHSTPFLSIKKRVHERSHSRGPPRLGFKVVFKRPQLSGFIGNDYQNQTSHEDEKAQDSSNSKKRCGNKSSNSSKNSPQSQTMSNPRLALGLSATGPLTLEQVKIAYRLRAMKWHPDHHQGIDKTFAEEHFKKINAAHESLCAELSTS